MYAGAADSARVFPEAPETWHIPSSSSGDGPGNPPRTSAAGTAEIKAQLRCSDETVPHAVDANRSSHRTGLAPVRVGSPSESALTVVKTHCPLLAVAQAGLEESRALEIAEGRGAGNRLDRAGVLGVTSGEGAGRACEVQAAGTPRFPRAAVRTLRDPLVAGVSQVMRQEQGVGLLKAIRGQMGQAEGRMRQLMRTYGCVPGSRSSRS